jgi:hypothetical protein
MAFHIELRVNLVKIHEYLNNILNLKKQFRLIYQAVNKRNSLDVLLQLIIICLIVV